MKAVKGNEEYKQRVNLSTHAATVLMQDRDNCAPDAPLAGFLNDIITRYSVQATASIDIAVTKRCEYLKKILSGSANKADLDAIIHKLTEDYRNELIAAQQSSPYPKGESVLFRLNKDNFKMLYGTEDQPGKESSNYARPSLYLKALFEEFTRLPTSERERFYFSYLFDLVDDCAVPHGYLLEIALEPSIRYIVRPYKILPNTDSTHLYLAGLSRPADDPDSPERIASFRVSHLRDRVTVRKDLPKQPLRQDNIWDIEDRLRKNGIQYLVSDDCEQIRLRFHHGGEKIFRNKTYLRPVPDSKTEDGIYTFSCSMRQIGNYFFSFGSSVEILAPEKLRKVFQENYREALSLYTED